MFQQGGVPSANEVRACQYVLNRPRHLDPASKSGTNWVIIDKYIVKKGELRHKVGKYVCLVVVNTSVDRSANEVRAC